MTTRTIRIVVRGAHHADCRSLQPPVTTIDGDRATVTGYYCAGCLPRPWEEIRADLRAVAAGDTPPAGTGA